MILTLAAAVAIASATGADADKSFLRALKQRRNLKSKCWTWCSQGKCSWSWSGCECRCNQGWEGSCCNVESKCRPGTSYICDWSKMKERTFSSANVVSGNPLTNEWEKLPEQLQGIFWLKDQGDSSSIMSFGKSNDGSYLSTGELDASKEHQYSVRVGGDRTWSFNDKAKSWVLVEALDLIYKFKFNSATDPTYADIIPYARNLGITVSWTGLLNFQMRLMTADEKEERLKDTVVWARPSTVLGIEAESSYYELTQIIDGNGKKTAAFDNYVAYTLTEETGETPGTIHYREAN